MANNRLTYNVQDVFVGSEISAPTGNYQIHNSNADILKRVEGVQSFNYDFNIGGEDVSILGVSENVDKNSSAPIDVQVDLEYYNYNINNEDKLGFYTQNQNQSGRLNFISNFTGQEKDYRNLYLITNFDNSEDIRTQFDGYPNFDDAFASGSIDPKSSGYNLLSFVKCHVVNYNANFSIGQAGKSNVSLVADNSIFNSSASGIFTPFLNTKTREIEHSGLELVVPKKIKNTSSDYVDSYLQYFAPDNINVNITKDESGKTAYASAFNSDHDGWNVTRMTVTAPDTHVGESNTARFNSTATAGEHFIYRTVFEPGRSYRIKGKIFISTDQINQVQLRYSTSANNNNPDTTALSITTVGEWVYFETNIIAPNNQYLWLYGLKDGAYEWSASTADRFYIKDIVVEEVVLGFEIDSIQSIDLSVDLNRENIAYLNNKCYSERNVSLPSKASLGMEMIVSGSKDGDLNKLKQLDNNYNVVVDFNKTGELKMNYIISGAKLESVNYSSSIGSNSTASLEFSVDMDMDNNKRGVFVSGILGEITGVLIDDSGNIIVDDSGNTVVGTLFPQY